MDGLRTKTDWHTLAVDSHYQTATAIRQHLLAGDVEEAIAGIEALIEALSRSDRRALRSQLIRLMAHVIKWQSQPNRRSRSWVVTIANARIEIEELVEMEPSLRLLVPDLIDELFDKATRLAEKEMGRPGVVDELSWEEIFEDDYDLLEV